MPGSIWRPSGRRSTWTIPSRPTEAINYAYNKGVTWAVLTNFEALRVYNAEWDAENPNLNLLFECENYPTDPNGNVVVATGLSVVVLRQELDIAAITWYDGQRTPDESNGVDR